MSVEAERLRSSQSQKDCVKKAARGEDVRLSLFTGCLYFASTESDNTQNELSAVFHVPNFASSIRNLGRHHRIFSLKVTLPCDKRNLTAEGYTSQWKA